VTLETRGSPGTEGPAQHPPRTRDLDAREIPSLLEDHLWRRLQLLERDGALTPVTILWSPSTLVDPPF
jgi:hypothetical protein